jgi:hypothetical protein
MRNLFLFFMFVACLPIWANDREFELQDPNPAPVEAWQNVKTVTFGWGTIDKRYQRNEVPVLSSKIQLNCWRGERVNAQAVLLAPQAIRRLSVKVSDLKCGKKVIPASTVNRYFVCYALADAFRNKSGKVDQVHINHANFDSSLVADRLSPLPEMSIPAQTLRPIWLDIRIPQDAAAGKYTAELTADCDGKKYTIPFVVEVNKHVLPAPKDWSFHLDLWQNPYAVARYYNVPLWSEAHFNHMRPIMKLLADAGQKVITTSIIQHPWNGQTEDPFESMIGKTKKLNGQWEYNYTVFDKWVEFMMGVGINQQIDCYTIVPWHLSFEYFDETVNCTRVLKLKPGTQEYADFLLPFLKDFAAHLKQKGWFDKTCIAMDERPMEMLRAAWDVVYKADPNYRIEGAADYYPEVEPKMYDLSVTYQHKLLSEEVLRVRKESGKKVTFYTCCGPERPNTFTFSPPAESAVMGWHAMAAGYDGYLRWAYNSWVKAPNQDGRFRTWASGDCFLAYPGGSCIRMERLVQGIQDFEKIKILRTELKGAKLELLNKTVEMFRPNVFPAENNAAEMINKAEAVLYKLSK